MHSFHYWIVQRRAFIGCFSRQHCFSFRLIICYESLTLLIIMDRRITPRDAFHYWKSINIIQHACRVFAAHAYPHTWELFETPRHCHAKRDKHGMFYKRQRCHTENIYLDARCFQKRRLFHITFSLRRYVMAFQNNIKKELRDIIYMKHETEYCHAATCFHALFIHADIIERINEKIVSALSFILYICHKKTRTWKECLELSLFSRLI